MRVFLQAIVAQLLLNPYIYWRGKQALPKKPGYQWPFAALFILELAIYFTGYLFHDELPDKIMIPILYICGTWYIASIYVTLALLCLELIRLSDKLLKWYPQAIYLNLETIKRTLFVLITIGVTVLMFHANHTVTHPSVKHVYIDIPKKVPGRDSLKIVLMSDLHIGEMIGKEMVQKYVRLSNEQQPDLVLLAGDIMDYESRFAEQAHIEDDLRDSSFYLVGRDDYINKKRKTLQAIVKGIDHSKPLIVLDHQPNSFAEMTMNGVDLGLHGHTHNGQIWPYPLVMKLVFECPYGYYRKGNTQFYVSSGIGIAGPPYRVGTASELVVLHVRFGG